MHLDTVKFYLLKKIHLDTVISFLNLSKFSFLRSSSKRCFSAHLLSRSASALASIALKKASIPAPETADTPTDRKILVELIQHKGKALGDTWTNLSSRVRVPPIHSSEKTFPRSLNKGPIRESLKRIT